MNKKLLALLIAILSFNTLCMAQDDETLALAGYVEQLNGTCPIVYDKDWAINSLTLVGTYVLADMEIPANLSMILPTLTEDTEGVKKLWFKQFRQYGDQWEHLVGLIVANGYRLVLNLSPGGDRKSALLTLLPTDLVR